MDYSQVPPDTLRQWLSEAQIAVHKLLIGRLSVEVSVDGTQMVRYNKATLPQLQAYVSTLQAARAGRPTRGAINFVF